MFRRIALIALIVPILLTACSEDESSPVAPSATVFQVSDAADLFEATSAARSGDTIVLSGEGPAVGDFFLPTDVNLQRHQESLNELFEIVGSLSVTGSESGTLIEGLKISNPDGSGLVMVNCDAQVSDCWFVNCVGAGVELIGQCGAYIHTSDFEACMPGVLMRDVASGGHYSEDTAPTITSNNFTDNTDYYVNADLDPEDERLGPNVAFMNIGYEYTADLRFNWWGAAPGQMDIPGTIWDNGDDGNNQGFVNTDGGIIDGPYDRIWHTQ